MILARSLLECIYNLIYIIIYLLYILDTHITSCSFFDGAPVLMLHLSAVEKLFNMVQDFNHLGSDQWLILC